MRAALPYLRIALPALLTVCIFIGTFGVQFKYVIDGTSYLWVYFYMETGAYDNPIYFAQQGWEFFGCPPPFHTINAALAMGVIGCAFSLAGAATSILLYKAPTSAPLVLASRVSCLLATLTIITSMIIAIIFYKSKFCDGSVTISETWDLGYGFAFLVISSIITGMWSILEIVIAVSRVGIVSGASLDENTPLNN